MIQQTQESDVEPMLLFCWACVIDGGPILKVTLSVQRAVVTPSSNIKAAGAT